MSWMPTGKETEYINLIQSMCLDSLMSRGVANRETFVSNLEMIAKQMKELPKEPISMHSGMSVLERDG